MVEGGVGVGGGGKEAERTNDVRILLRKIYVPKGSSQIKLLHMNNMSLY